MAWGGMASEAHRAWLAEWFRDWRGPLRRFLARKRFASNADIDDIAQEVFLRLLRYGRAELVTQPQAYLFKIASNVSEEWRMRASRRLPHDDAWLAELTELTSPDVELECVDARKQVTAAVMDLPSRAREILRLHFAEEKTYAEIASSMGITLRIVHRDVERAYAALRLSLALPDQGRRRDASGAV